MCSAASSLPPELTNSFIFSSISSCLEKKLSRTEVREKNNLDVELKGGTPVGFVGIICVIMSQIHCVFNALMIKY